MSNSSCRLWLLGLTYLSSVLCVIGIGRPSFWIDEAHSFEFADFQSFWLVIVNAAARDAYPPLYFLLLRAWMYVSQDEAWLRLFSVLCHLACIPLVFLIGERLAGQRLAGRSVGLIAACLMAVSPFHMAFAREARMYSFVCLLALSSQLGLLMWIGDRARKGYALFVLAGIGLLYTHFMGALLLAAQAVFLALDRPSGREARRRIRLWIVALGAAFLPWSPFFLKAFLVTRGYGGEAPPHMLVFYFVSALLAGFEQAPWLLLVSAAVMALLAAAGIWGIPAGRPRRFLLVWAFVPLFLELAVTAAGKPVFGERTLIISTPAFLILAAAAIAGPASRAAWLKPAAAGAAGLLAGLGFAHSLAFGMREAPDHRAALESVAAAVKPGDAVLHGSFATYHPVHSYYLVRRGAPALDDFLIEEQGEFAGGRLGNWFRSRWRKLRGKLDPAGEVKSGRDPHRLSQEEFAARRFGRIWFLHTDISGARRIWRLIPSVFYSPPADKVRVTAFGDLERASAGFELVRAEEYPGLRLELYTRKPAREVD